MNCFSLQLFHQNILLVIKANYSHCRDIELCCIIEIMYFIYFIHFLNYQKQSVMYRS